MNNKVVLLFVCIISNAIPKILCSVEDGSFFETDADFRRMHRNLLQTDEGNDVSDETDEGETVENKVEPTEPPPPPQKGIFEVQEELNGPQIFHPPDFQFLMGVEEGIMIHFPGGSSENLGEATAITGSATTDTEAMVNIDWKKSSNMLKMKFNETRTEFVLLEMSLHRGTNIYELDVKTPSGDDVRAPKGLAWACDEVYRPADKFMFKVKEGDKAKVVGVGLPNVRLQVFFPKSQLNFGPLWYCGVLMPIGLWVGLIVTLFFALVCYWGFSMLASIQTMDRFDDPKGKQIYVPQTE